MEMMAETIFTLVQPSATASRMVVCSDAGRCAAITALPRKPPTCSSKNWFDSVISLTISATEQSARDRFRAELTSQQIDAKR
jgi:hypothetical protein